MENFETSLIYDQAYVNFICSDPEGEYTEDFRNSTGYSQNLKQWLDARPALAISFATWEKEHGFDEALAILEEAFPDVMEEWECSEACCREWDQFIHEDPDGEYTEAFLESDDYIEALEEWKRLH